MCRNIKVLFNFDPGATREEIDQASLQYVRKISGYQKPSDINERVFNQAVKDISAATSKLIKSLKTTAAKKDRIIEAQKRKLQSEKRFQTNR